MTCVSFVAHHTPASPVLLPACVSLVPCATSDPRCLGLVCPRSTGPQGTRLTALRCSHYDRMADPGPTPLLPVATAVPRLGSEAGFAGGLRDPSWSPVRLLSRSCVMPPPPPSEQALDVLLARKEEEWRALQAQRSQLQEAALREAQARLRRLQEDFVYNLQVLEERDRELERYDAAFAQARGLEEARQAEASELRIEAAKLRQALTREAQRLEDLQQRYRQKLQEHRLELERVRRWGTHRSPRAHTSPAPSQAAWPFTQTGMERASRTEAGAPPWQVRCKEGPPRGRRSPRLPANKPGMTHGLPGPLQQIHQSQETLPSGKPRALAAPCTSSPSRGSAREHAACPAPHTTSPRRVAPRPAAPRAGRDASWHLSPAPPPLTPGCPRPCYR